MVQQPVEDLESSDLIGGKPSTERRTIEARIYEHYC